MIEKINKTDEAIVITKFYNAPVEKVFEAWSNSEILAQWFSPSEEITHTILEVDFNEEGQYRIGFQTDEETVHTVAGKYQTIQLNKKIVFTWQWEEPHELANIKTLVTINFKENNNGTELTLTHEGITDLAASEDHDQGWNGCFIRLSKLIEKE